MPTLPYIDKNKKTIESPHVVILGAGASKAAFPNGDANGKTLPLMNELVEILDLKDTIAKHGYIGNTADFESFYSEIFKEDRYKDLVHIIQERARSYFEELELPKKVTIYDYLILSLREKDIIASFNWDPLLLKTYLRNINMKSLPELAFLHGNVFLGVCYTDKQLGYLGSICIKCHKPLSPVQLLYPVTEKNYNKDPVIKDQWSKLTDKLNYCYFLTIFGYSAPKVDYEAIELMKTAWSTNRTSELAQIEVIDIKSNSELKENWSDFTIREHYGIYNNFKQSCLWWFPRQTCEALFDATMQNNPRAHTSFPETESLIVLHRFINELKIESLHI